jgi:tetratricopeptide repeat protein
LLDDRLRVLGADHPHTRSSLAYWRGVVGDPVGAVAAFEELLDDYLRVLGADHPDTLTIRHHLAHWRGRVHDQGELR